MIDRQRKIESKYYENKKTPRCHVSTELIITIKLRLFILSNMRLYDLIIFIITTRRVRDTHCDPERVNNMILLYYYSNTRACVYSVTNSDRVQ